MFNLFRQHSRVTASPRRAIGLCAVLLSVGVTVGAQSSDSPVRLLESVKKSAMQQEVDRLAEAGFDILLAHLDPPRLTAQTGWLLAQRGQETGARSYRFVEDLEALLTKGQLDAGYRLLPQTLTRGKRLLGEDYFCAIFQKMPVDSAAREYVFVRGGTPEHLEKRARAIPGNGLVPVAIDSHRMPAVGIFERQAHAEPWKVLATTLRETMENELSAAAADGYRIVAASGGEERVFALVQRADAPPVEYKLLEPERSASLERDMNEMAAQGFRFAGASLLSVGNSLGGRTGLAMERTPAPSPTAYRVVGARRAGTIDKELSQAVTKGFRILAATVGYTETVIVLAKPAGETTTTVR